LIGPVRIVTDAGVVVLPALSVTIAETACDPGASCDVSYVTV
jgi:hypothetical protein